MLRRLLNRPADANKYDFGHVLVIGGSPGMVGAPLLAAEAALRTGAGLATVASTPEVTDKLERRVEEVMTLRLPQTGAAETLMDFVRRRKVSALVIGPGLKPDFTPIVRGLARRLTLPIVLDAGGLAAFRGHLSALKPNLILTPHSGEFESLTGHPLPPDPQKTVVDFAKTHKVIVVLKRHQTLVAYPDGQAYQNRTGNPGLATAGTGDVLSGIIAGLLAQGIPAAEAAQTGVYLHGLAGDLAAQAKTQAGMIASDVIEHIPAALKTARATNL